MGNAPFLQNPGNQPFAFCAKWFGCLFWLSILGILIGILFSDKLLGRIAVLDWAGQILSVLLSLGNYAVLFVLSRQYSRYRTAAVFFLFAEVLNIVFIAAGGAWWGFLFAIAAAVLSLTGLYHEYYSHAEVAASVNFALSQKWRRLFKWNIAGCCVSVASSLIMLLSAVLASFTPTLIGSLLLLLTPITLIASLLVILVVSILEIVYLSRTARAFRETSGSPQ